MKKRLMVSLAVLIFIGATAAATSYAANEITIWIHGKKVSSDVPVKIENGMTIVPIRSIAEMLDQSVQWDQTTQTVTIDDKNKTSLLERMVIQRGVDIFIADHPEDDGYWQAANQAILYNLTTLYNAAYRGLYNNAPERKNANEISLLADSEASQEGTAASSHIYIRLQRLAYVPEAGENAPASKDIIFYTDTNNPNDLNIAVQDPTNLQEWTVYQVSNYGDWLKKEIDIYIRGTRAM
ncbi:MAG: hypothetical protein J7639_22715 [Paenibacillaceae bacterium]|nr:hypothetical protein [Paenibacillaceae bacterium]